MTFLRAPQRMQLMSCLKKQHFLKLHNKDKNLFEVLEISINKSTKCYTPLKHQDWYADKVLEQLKCGVHMDNWHVDVFKSKVNRHLLSLFFLNSFPVCF